MQPGSAKTWMPSYCPPLPRPPRAGLGEGVESTADVPLAEVAVGPLPPRPPRDSRGEGATSVSRDMLGGGAVAGRGEEDLGGRAPPRPRPAKSGFRKKSARAMSGRNRRLARGDWPADMKSTFRRLVHRRMDSRGTGTMTIHLNSHYGESRIGIQCCSSSATAATATAPAT